MSMRTFILVGKKKLYRDRKDVFGSFEVQPSINYNQSVSRCPGIYGQKTLTRTP